MYKTTRPDSFRPTLEKDGHVHEGELLRTHGEAAISRTKIGLAEHQFPAAGRRKDADAPDKIPSAAEPEPPDYGGGVVEHGST